MAQERLLSTDPQAGQLLSTDPAAGVAAKAPSAPEPTYLDRAVEWLPAVGGTVGGVLGNIPGALIGGAAGEAYKELINRARGRSAPQSATEAAGNIALQAGVQGTAQGAGQMLGAGMSWMAPRLMHSAVKPTLAMVKEYNTSAQGIVKTLLDEGINVTEGGLAKLQGLFNATNAEIRTALQNATGSVSKPAVAARALTTAAKVAKQTNPTRDLAAVGETVEEFLNHPVYPGNLSLPEAQAMKVGTYQQIGKKYGEVSSAAIETQKALARGLKEEIAAEVPEISALNERDSALMAALDAVGRRVALSGNKDPIGFAWVAHNPTTFVAALIDRNPTIKSLLARGMYDHAAKVAKVSPAVLRTALAAIASENPDATKQE